MTISLQDSKVMGQANAVGPTLIDAVFSSFVKYLEVFHRAQHSAGLASYIHVGGISGGPKTGNLYQ